MHCSSLSWIAVVLCGVISVGCTRKRADDDDHLGIQPAASSRHASQSEAPSASPATGTPSASAPYSASASAGHVPGQYSFDGIRTIADGCTESWTVLTVVTPELKERNPGRVWPSIVQALYAHPQFVLVAGQPSSPGQIALFEGRHGESNHALWAQCSDGATCNKLAAMYRGVTPTARPWVYCGKGDTKVDRAGSRLLFASRAALDSHAKDKLVADVESLCDRVGVCYLREKGPEMKDIWRECQMKPSTFPYKCGNRTTCPEVIDCVGK